MLNKIQLLIATSNRGKFKEFEGMLSGRFLCIEVIDPVEVEEDGATYRENALKKAKAYHNAFQIPVLADDSGLEVDALQGEPGVLSARYGGDRLSWEERWKYLHEKLAHVPESQRTAMFRCVLCFTDGIGPPRFYEGTTEGLILPHSKGHGGFGYDPIFFSLKLKKSFAEASQKEKDSISHRAIAIRAFLSSFP